MSLKDYYNNLPKNQITAFRDRIIAECDISYPTFYTWLNNPSSVGKLHREKIAEIAQQPVELLFPNSEA